MNPPTRNLIDILTVVENIDPAIEPDSPESVALVMAAYDKYTMEELYFIGATASAVYVMAQRTAAEKYLVEDEFTKLTKDLDIEGIAE